MRDFVFGIVLRLHVYRLLALMLLVGRYQILQCVLE